MSSHLTTDLTFLQKGPEGRGRGRRGVGVGGLGGTEVLVGT